MDKTSMPPPPPRRPRDAGDLRKQALGGLLAAAGPTAPSPAHSSEQGVTELGSGITADQTDQNAWKQYWDERKEVELPHRGGTFNVYSAGSSGPVLFAVHGAGYTGLTWSLVAGALKIKYRIIAPDLRGHGLTTAQPETDFSKETMSEDLVAIWDALFASTTQQESSSETTTQSTAAEGSNTAAAPGNAQKQAEGDPKATVIVGHSMGGATAVWAAASRKLPHVQGCVVVDVVEGTAIAALPHMGSVIAARPTSFQSPAAAISWALRSGMSRCKEAASISIPAQLAHDTDSSHTSKQSDVKDTVGSAVPGTQPGQSSSILDTLQHTHHGQTMLGSSAAIQEEEEEGEEGENEENEEKTDTTPIRPSTTSTSVDTLDQQASIEHAATESAQAATVQSSLGHAATTTGSCSTWHWRTSLKATQPYWEGWYQGLSDAFLGLPIPKMLLLAGTDRLDKQLTIGQMQGKFQLVLLPTAGHAIQEDDSLATSNALDMFTSRQRIGQPPLAIPRAPIGTKPVLPIVAGPVL